MALRRFDEEPCAVKSCVDEPLSEGLRIQTRASCGDEDCVKGGRVVMIAVCKPFYNDLAPSCKGGFESRLHSP